MDVVTFGCKLNIFESEIIKKKLEEASIEDVIVFNTCSVTQEAEKQALQAIRRSIKQHPDKKIIVTGCSAQLNPEKYKTLDGVYKVIGNPDKFSLDNYLNDQQVVVTDIMTIKEISPHLVTDFEANTRAFIQIQNGCNHRCTFCIIPYGRGNSRSVSVATIVEQIKLLVDKGYKEIVLTGVDITDYGLDLPGQPKLGEMIRRVLNLVPELPRLRLSSVDVAEIDDTLFDLIINEPRLMPHIHISLQAGDNMILKRMKRRHTREQVIEFAIKAKKARPEIVIGGDIIAGFPTETPEMFENSLALIKEVDIPHLHVFPFSPRQGTPAARMPQIARHIIKERAAILRAAGQEMLANFSKKQLRKTHSVLVEDNNIARTETFLKVRLKQETASGTIINATIVDYQDGLLLAEAQSC